MSARKRRRMGVLRRVLFHAVALTLSAVVLYPVLWMVMSAFKPSSEIVGDIGILPDTWTTANFSKALDGIAGVSFWTYVANSLFLASAAAVGVVLSSSLTAYAFARIDFPGRRLFFAVMIGTLLLPFQVLVIPQYVMFNHLGLVNTYYPLLLPKFLGTEAFFVFLMVQFIRSLPRELDEAARVDGAGHLRIFGSIVFPLLRPAVVTSAVFAFIWTWNDFLGPLLYLKRGDLSTLPLALRQYVDQTSVSDYGAQLAMAVLVLVPVLLFFAVFQRYIVEGVATQGIKG